MAVIWSESAQNDLKLYIENSKIYTRSKLNEYIDSLINYANTLDSSPELGKIFIKYNNVTIRQLLYGMHRIFYFVDNDDIIIIQIAHTKRNIQNVLRIMKKYFNY